MLELKPCQAKTRQGRQPADCGTLFVPENRSRPGSRLIALPVIRFHSPDAHPAEPIFYLGGGPGLSNMGFHPPEGLLARHDIILVGYRGVDGSSVLDMPHFRKAMHGVGGDLLSRASLRSLAQAVQADAHRLQQAGVDLDGYTILEVIADLEDARLALGYERIHLLSESYGTRIAQIYAQQHPGRIHRSALIGVNPPGRFVWDPGTIDRQVEYDAGLWAQDPRRAALSPDLADALRSVSQNMPSRWLLLPIDPGKVKIMAFVMLFNRKTAAQVYDAFLAARRGDPSGLALLSLAYDLMLPGMFTWGDFIAKAFSADFDPKADYAAWLDRSGSILGSPLSMAFWGSGMEWPAKELPDEFRQAQPSDVETLLVSGSADFSTPAETAAQELLPGLAHGKQVILREMGHVGDLWGLQPEAMLHMLSMFYDTGQVDSSRFQYQPADFRVGLGFPRLAKILLGVGVLAPVVLAVAVRNRRVLAASFPPAQDAQQKQEQVDEVEI